MTFSPTKLQTYSGLNRCQSKLREKKKYKVCCLEKEKEQDHQNMNNSGGIQKIKQMVKRTSNYSSQRKKWL